MPISEEIEKIDWRKELLRLNGLLAKDSSTYMALGIFFAILSVVLSFLFIAALVITIPATMYFFYCYFKNKKAELIAYTFKITSKKRWHKSKSPSYRPDDPEAIDDSYTSYFFEVESQIKFKINNLGLGTLETHKKLFVFEVNYIMYDEFQVWDESCFIFSPSNDLMAYLKNNEVVLLVQTRTLSNGEKFSSSVSIPQQNAYPSARSGFELITD